MGANEIVSKLGDMIKDKFYEERIKQIQERMRKKKEKQEEIDKIEDILYKHKEVVHELLES